MEVKIILFSKLYNYHLVEVENQPRLHVMLSSSDYVFDISGVLLTAIKYRRMPFIFLLLDSLKPLWQQLETDKKICHFSGYTNHLLITIQIRQ